MKKYVKNIISVTLIAAMLLTSVCTAFANDGAAGGVKSPYDTYIWETFDTQVELTNPVSYQIPYPTETVINGDGDWTEIQRTDGNGNAVKIHKKEADSANQKYPALDLKLENSGISVADAKANNLMVEVEFDYYGTSLPTDDNFIWLTSKAKTQVDTTSGANVPDNSPKFRIKKNGQINASKISVNGETYSVSNETVKALNESELAEFHKVKFVFYADTFTKADNSTVDGWFLKSVYYDGAKKKEYTDSNSVYMGSDDFKHIYFRFKSTANYAGEFGVDNVSVKALPVVYANYNFNSEAAISSATGTAERCIYDGTTFDNNYAYKGAYYWDFDNDNSESMQGYSTRIKITDKVNFSDLPANSYVETAMDIMYKINTGSYISLDLEPDSSEKFARFKIDKEKIFYNEKAEFNVSANEDNMHRLKITIQIKDAEGNIVNKITGLNVDGIDAPSNYSRAFDTAVTDYKYIRFSTGNSTDISELWIANLSVISYVSADGKSPMTDKLALADGLTQLSSIKNYLNTDAVANADKIADLDVKAESIAKVYTNAGAVDVDSAADKTNSIIAGYIQDDFSAWLSNGDWIGNITQESIRSHSSFASEITQKTYDVKWSGDILGAENTVFKPRINTPAALTSVVTYCGNSETVLTENINGTVLAEGSAAALPRSGNMLAYADVTAEAEGTATVTATGISETVDITTGKNTVQVYIDTDADKYAVFVNGEKVKQDAYTADSVEEIKINSADAKVIKSATNDLIKFTGVMLGADGAASSIKFMNMNVFDDAFDVVVSAYSDDNKVLLKSNEITVSNEHKLNQIMEYSLSDLMADITNKKVGIKAFAYASIDTLEPVANAYSYEAQ